MDKKLLELHPDTKNYNKALPKSDREICDVLATEITRNLKGAENKIWHRHPVWFLDGNPIVGYDKLKNCVRLLFWSGQSFNEDGLKNEGSFKASEARYTDVSEIKKKDLKRWLEKAREIQWDYKNIVKRKGVLKKIVPAEPSEHRIYRMSFASVYPLYVAKAEKKGRTKEEVDEIIRWLTGYKQRGLEAQIKKQTDFKTFFAEAPLLNPNRSLVKGIVCGVRVEDIVEPTMREIRYLDKLIDELARGKAMERILRK